MNVANQFNYYEWKETQEGTHKTIKIMTKM